MQNTFIQMGSVPKCCIIARRLKRSESFGFGIYSTHVDQEEAQNR